MVERCVRIDVDGEPVLVRLDGDEELTDEEREALVEMFRAIRARLDQEASDG